MISYLKGTLEALEEDKVVIDVGGIGYGVFMSVVFRRLVRKFESIQISM